MEARKLYAGAKLREVRTRMGLRQVDYAAKLGVSVSYLNQMENNHRPIPARLVVALAEQFGLDVTELAAGTTERMVADLREALADPVFGEMPPMADLQLVASNAPNLGRAFLALHRAHREGQERLAQLNEALGREDAPLGAAALGGGARLLPLLRQLHRRDRPGGRALRRGDAGAGPAGGAGGLAGGAARHRGGARARRAAQALRPGARGG
jgi:transcriptional regulator with XRE-family HTH domain